MCVCACTYDMRLRLSACMHNNYYTVLYCSLHRTKINDNEMGSNLTLLFGYKIMGDNIDKNVRPRYARQDNKTLSLHYFRCSTSSLETRMTICLIFFSSVGDGSGQVLRVVVYYAN